MGGQQTRAPFESHCDKDHNVFRGPLAMETSMLQLGCWIAACVGWRCLRSPTAATTATFAAKHEGCCRTAETNQSKRAVDFYVQVQAFAAAEADTVLR